MGDTTYTSTHSPTFLAPGGLGQIRQEEKVAGKSAIFWCSLLLLSLSYELPLYELTGYDRLNPRLFDVVLVFALLFSGWRLRIKDAFVGSWLALSLCFVAIAVLSYAFLLPADYRYFPLFYGIKYMEVLLFLLLISGFDWRRDQIVMLLKVFIFGVAFAGVWGILQKVGVLSSERYLPNGQLIAKQQGVVLATYGTTYFHAGVMGAMGATVALALRMQNQLSWLLFLPVFFLGVFLALFAGSRAGLALFLFAATLIVFRKSLYVVLGICVVTSLLLLPGVLDYLTGESITIQRIVDTDSANSVENRLSLGTIEQIGRLIDYHGAGLLLYGGGFYAVPMPLPSGLIQYRVGYGIHNIHLFPLEQAGVFGLLSAIGFWLVAFAKGWRARRSELGASGLALLAGIAVLGWAGQIFYLGFGTENMLAAQLGVIYLLLSYTAAAERTGDGRARAQAPTRGLAAALGSNDQAATSAHRENSAPVASAGDGADPGRSVDAKADEVKSSPLERFLER